MTVIEYIKAQKRKTGRLTIERVVRADGFSISCQASRSHYCSPREDDADWTAIELGYPSTLPSVKIRAYAESKRDLLRTVYGYVPVALVDAMLHRHGGIVDKK